MKSQLKRYLGSLVFVFLLCPAIALGATAGVLFVYNSDLPQVNSLEDYHPSLVTEVYADDGQVIGSFALERRIVVTYDEIPQLVKDAIVSVEDQNFYTHWGIDIYGIARAAIKDLMAGRFVEGGSTLTQQLSKNLFLTPERHFRRKIQEAMLAIQIERYYTKPQILTMYCQPAFYGPRPVRFRCGRRLLLRKAAEGSQYRRGGDAGCVAAVANQLFADRPSRPRADAA